MRGQDAQRRADPAHTPAEEASLRRLTVVVLDWNLPDHTVRCVRSLIGDGVPAERVVVVENGPSEENWSRISAELSGCVLVRIRANVGFARGMNVGAAALPGDAYMLVNNDAFLHRPGSVAALVAALGRDRVGIVAPRLLNPDLSTQASVVPFTRPLAAFVRASGLSRFLPNSWQPRLSTHWDHGSSRVVPAAIGPVLLVAGRLWDVLEGFRESAFMYAEDIDLCWRASDLGWRTWFEADAEFLHLEGASSDRRWSVAERSARVARAEAEMIRSRLSRPRAAAAIAFMRLGLAVRARYFALVGDDQAAASCRGSLLGLSRPEPHEPVPDAPVEIVPPRTTDPAVGRSAARQEIADRGPGGSG